MIKKDFRRIDRKNYLYPDFYYVDRRGRKKERRRYRRFHCREGVVIFWDSKYGRVRNISLGGLSFSSIINDNDYALENQSEESINLDIIFKSEDLLVPGLPTEIIYDYHISETETTSGQSCYRKYYGGRFSDLSARQDFKIKSLILKGSYF